jgi:general secretion pathway protein K
MRSDRNERGVALLMTLFAVTLLTILVMEFTYSTEVEAHLTRTALSAMQARYLARAGAALAELALQVDLAEKAKNPPARPPVETLNDPWAQPFPPQPLGEGVGEAGFRIDDESARFNVNALAPGPGVNPVTLESRKMLFQGILTIAGLDVNLLFPLLDWLDPDDDVTSKSGAESEYYQTLPVPLTPRNGKVLQVEELLLIRGWNELTREQWAAVRPMLTALSRGDLKVNVNTASETVLTALLTAVDDAQAAKAIVARRDKEPIVAMADLDQIPGWSQIPQQVRGIFDIRSQIFTVHGIGVAAGVARGVAITEIRTGARLEVLDWRDEVGTNFLTSSGPSDGMTVPRP